jgi:hypothetical protein
MNFVQSNRGVPSITTNRSLLSNFPDRLTQTFEVTLEQGVKTPTARTARAKKATATSKSPRGKTLKQTGKVTGQKAKTRTRQTEPTQAERKDQRGESSDGASSENDNTDSESDDVGQGSSDGSDGDEDDEKRAGPSVQTLWYESDYGYGQESSDSE